MVNLKKLNLSDSEPLPSCSYYSKQHPDSQVLYSFKAINFSKLFSRAFFPDKQRVKPACKRLIGTERLQ